MKNKWSDRVKQAACGKWDLILQEVCSFSKKDTRPTKIGMPCPNCGGRDRYEFKSIIDGYHMCRGCGAGDGITMIRKLYNCSFPEALNRVAQFLGIHQQGDFSLHYQEGHNRKINETRTGGEGVDSAQKGQKVAAQEAREIFLSATGANPAFPYFINKRVGVYGVRQQNNRILVPLKDIDGNIRSLQYIYPNGKKYFHKGGAIKGCFHLVGEVNNTIYIAEGYATAASVFQLNKGTVPVAVAFTAGNLKQVAIELRKKYPQTYIVILADNDRFTPGNPGLTKAREAADAVHGEVRCPTFRENEPGTDYNDWINNQLQGEKAWA